MFIFGADIMLDDTGHAYILELNARPGHTAPLSFSDKGKNKYNLYHFPIIFKWLLDDIILPYFDKKNIYKSND